MTPTVTEGQRIPSVTFRTRGGAAWKDVKSEDCFAGRKAVLFSPPDGNGGLTEKLGLLVDRSDLGFGKRSWRYGMLVEDGVVTRLFIEPEIPGDPFQASAA